MATNARLLVQPAMAQPSAYGLLSVADLRGDADPHWRMGVTWQNMCPIGGTIVEACATSSPAITGAPGSYSFSQVNGTPLWGATPFTVYAEVDCSAPGFWDQREEMARQALARVETYQVEKAFWTGTASGVANAVYPHLASTTSLVETSSFGYTVTLQPQATIVTGAPLAPSVALGALENALADCLQGDAGVIHISNDMVPVMAGNGLIMKDGTRLRTHNGNFVVAANGYPRTGPDGSDPGVGHGWMFATGPIFAYRGNVELLTTPNGAPLVRTTNTVKAIAQRTYLVGFDCCLFAVLTSPSAIVTNVPA